MLFSEILLLKTIQLTLEKLKMGLTPREEKAVNNLKLSQLSDIEIRRNLETAFEKING